MPKKFSPELRERAVRMVLERQAAEGGPRAYSIRAIAPQVGVGEETLRMWCNRHEITQAPAGEDLQQENKRLKRELAEARRANEILKAASAFFARELVRAAQLEVLPAQLGDLLGFNGAEPWGFAVIDAILLPPVPQGVWGDPAEGFANGGAGDPGGALLGADAFFDELQGSCLELGGVLLGHDPILLEEVGRNETQGASCKGMVSQMGSAVSLVDTSYQAAAAAWTD